MAILNYEKICQSTDLTTVERNIQDMITLLVQYSDDLWKCLKYNTPDALSQPITTQDKLDLIDENGNAHRFQRKRFNNDIVDETICEVRLTMGNWRGVSKSTHDKNFLFEIICHNDIVTLDDGRNRVLTIQSEILKVLDNCRFDGIVGRLTSERTNGVSTSYNPKFQGIYFTLDAFTS